MVGGDRIAAARTAEHQQLRVLCAKKSPCSAAQFARYIDAADITGRPFETSGM